MSVNILLDYLPETVEISGKEYFVDTDYRTFMIFEKIISSSERSDRKVYDTVFLFYPDEKPTDLPAALDAVLHLYKCGDTAQKPARVRKNGNVELKPKLIYDYEYDAPYIYAAFLAQYGIDLIDIDYLHWWKFQALFKSLENHNKIVEIMGYRAADLSKIELPRERERIAQMKSLYALPQNLSFEDKVAMAGAAFGGCFA